MATRRKTEERLFDLAPYGRPFIKEGGLYAVHAAKPVLDFHAHAGYQLHFLLTGNLTRELRDGARQRLHGGSVSLLQPGVWHRGEHGVAHPCRQISLVLSSDPGDLDAFFSPRDAAGILRALGKAGNCVTHARDEQAAVVQHLLCATSEIRDRVPAPHQESWLRLLLGQLILCAVRAIVQPKPPPHYYVVAQACHLLEEDVSSRLSGSQIAAEVGLSPSRFRDLFQKVTGQTVANFRQSLRCEGAARYLATTSKTITEIAHELGFSSSQYFARSFRRYMGMSPSVYREKTAPPAGAAATAGSRRPARVRRLRPPASSPRL